ncbi:hypothetical protein SDRG_16738 [Saprolegnia diclina VS20]|uniref:Uncharacterized protein n=1 Tax=Saprolegnia diclina (strain VS20) TaxID=1156394 RepID=T0PT52_SAPDV|nr:hypothetical protein SDRG_16738 [Saprolegnia diclina VS20]EQC25411.1 hypothetical protein SDRG_16738 [Saprolegnia diclina VS20]|eukprot:XP_008621178.1 hypothetical protein SDRG_16738 [Saprolegnia diclina VS20]
MVDKPLTNRPDDDDDGLFHFQQKHVFSTANNMMGAVSLPQWLSILYTNGRHIEWQYMFRAAFLTFASIFAFFVGLIESLWYPSHVIEAIPLPDDPLPPRLRQVIQTRAAGYFKTFGYAT